MGGGDLNLKKWHPSIVKNIEEVWEVEQQNQGKQKIVELEKEIEMEDEENVKKRTMEQIMKKKDDKKLDWMYKGPNQLINREEYLLGRSIDKSFEQMVQAEKDTELNHTPRNHVEHECVPPSLRFFSGNEQVDLARKMQEDPLYTIKKKEMETRNQLLKNPVKLKQLRQLLEQQTKKSKTEKKHKKKKKKSRQDEIDSDNESQLDKLLVIKYKQLKDKINDKELLKSMKKVKHKRKEKSRKKFDRSKVKFKTSSEENSSDGGVEKHKKNKKYKSKENNNRQITEHDKNMYIKRKIKVFDKRVRNYSSSSERNDALVYRKKCEVDKSDYRCNTKNTSNRLGHEGATYYKSSFGAIHRKSNEQDRSKDRWNSKWKQHLTEEEKEERRQEMIRNATWRDKEREKGINKYREQKEEMDISKVYNQDFIRKQLITATETGTVASRIKANINNIQRSGQAMDMNFVKR